MEKELENLQKAKLWEREGKISSAVEAVEPSGEGDEDPCDDVKSFLLKASLSVDLTSASIETPSLNCCMGKTETENLWDYTEPASFATTTHSPTPLAGCDKA